MPSCGSVFRGSPSGWLLRRRGVRAPLGCASAGRAASFPTTRTTAGSSCCLLQGCWSGPGACLCWLGRALRQRSCGLSGDVEVTFSISIAGLMHGTRECADCDRTVARGRVCRCNRCLHLVPKPRSAQARDVRVLAQCGLWADEWGQLF